MAKARRDRALWDLLVEAFRERPGNFSHAARHAGTTRRAAKHAWEFGWAKVSWARPIKSVVHEEGDEAQLAAAAARADRERERRAREDLASADRERLRAERVRQLAEDAELLGTAVRGASQLAKTVLGLAPVLAQCARAAMREFFDEEVGLDGKTSWKPKAAPNVSADRALLIAKRIADITAKVALASSELVRLRDERRPAEEAGDGVEDMLPEEARAHVEHLAALAQTLRDYEEAGLGGTPGGSSGSEGGSGLPH
jgi:hypothetical protein